MGIVHFGSIDHPACTSVQYTHLLCFWKGGGKSIHDVAACTNGDTSPIINSELDHGGSIPDVLARGQKPWALRKAARCMGSNSVHVVLKWALRRLPGVDTVVDPFCGAGTVLAIANALGLHAIGVDISPRRVKQALVLDGKVLLAGRENAQPRDHGGT